MTERDDFVVLRDSLGGHLGREAKVLHRFTFYGESWAVTHRLNPIGNFEKDRFVVTHTRTGTKLPGFFFNMDAAVKGGKQFLRDRGKAEMRRAIAAFDEAMATRTERAQ